MEEGFLPDFAFNAVIQMLWHAGKAERSTVLGVRTGSLKLDRTQFIATTAHRCPKCGEDQPGTLAGTDKALDNIVPREARNAVKKLFGI